VDLEEAFEVRRQQPGSVTELRFRERAVGLAEFLEEPAAVEGGEVVLVVR